MIEPRLWECSRCPASAATAADDPRAPMHDCPGLVGLSVPMTRAGEHVDIRTVEREDYVAGEDVRYDLEGTPIMRTEVEHDDGHVDVWVYAPTAHFGARAA
jgi:hypothetical protein